MCGLSDTATCDRPYCGSIHVITGKWASLATSRAWSGRAMLEPGHSQVTGHFRDVVSSAWVDFRKEQAEDWPEWRIAEAAQASAVVHTLRPGGSCKPGQRGLGHGKGCHERSATTRGLTRSSLSLCPHLRCTD